MTRAMVQACLVANRGEIAVRVIKACHEMGLRAVAVYSEADRDALHVHVADEAFSIGPAPAAQSYLNVPAIVEAALQAGADSVHPGYGFLSENPDFAEAVAAAGLTWIGPPASAIRAMADKAAAKRLMEQAGVPVVPGYHGEAADDETLAREAEGIGYPLLVKAAGGGGGRGMRVVGSADELPEVLASARREALSAFGDDRLLLERYLANPRHIEVQVLFDGHKSGVVLGERECSLQRRHQKVVEEAPALGLSPGLRWALREAAHRAAAAIGYVNAGTVEFLVVGEELYFLEMNTRLQVEHGVTEMVTGIDIVQQQIRIAAGENLAFRQEDVVSRGHAIEARVYAEDVHAGFRPSPGRLLLFEPPQGGGVRNDVGVYEGGEVSEYYDPLVGKLLVHGADRDEAVRRLCWALGEYVVAGVATDLPLLRAIAEHPAFTSGETSTQVLEAVILPAFLEQGRAVPSDVLVAAAGYETLVEAARAQKATAGVNPWRSLGAWRGGQSERIFRYDVDGEAAAVRVAPAGPESWRVRVGEEERVVSWRLTGSRLLLAESGASKRFAVAATRAGVSVVSRGGTYDLHHPARSVASRRTSAGATDSRAAKGLTAPMPAVVAKVLVRVGEKVRAHQTVVVLEAMKMEHSIETPMAGTVAQVHFREGDRVPEGAVLVEIT